MKNMRFTQVISVTVTLEAEIPDDWTEDDIQDFSSDCATSITVDDPDDYVDYPHNTKDTKIVSLSVDGADIIDSTVWEVKPA